MQFLQVLQKASPLETLQNDGVAGGQTDTGPEREEKVDIFHKYAI